MKTFLNLFKTGILFAILTAILLAIGYFIGGTDALLPFFIISLVMNVASYWFSSSIALKMARARPLDPDEAPEIHEVVRELSGRMNIPTPKLYTSDDPQPNAFATGRNPSNGVVCVTSGLIKLLDHAETKGVIAHELSHIKNRDILTGTIAAVMAGAISYFAHMGMFFSGNDDDRGSSAGNILVIILAPIAATLVQLAISRSREYAADEGAALATKEPMELAEALQKIEGYAHQLPMRANPALASLYIQNPFKGGGMLEWFSTHPPTAKRVARLQAIQNLNK
jgi:heat shock protein HtpX